MLPTEPRNENVGYVVVNESTSASSQELFSNLFIPDNKKRSYELASALFDNYDILANVADDITPDEFREIDELMDFVIDTSPMKLAKEFYDSFRSEPLSRELWYTLIRNNWFRSFQIGSSPTRSGFEHVFLGEVKGSKVGGLHWWYFYLNKMKDIVYKNASYSNTTGRVGLITPEVVTMSFSWTVNGRLIQKPVGGFLVGLSVEGLMALGMVRANSNASNIAIIDGVEYDFKMFKSPDGASINTFYPIVRRLVSGGIPSSGANGTTSKTTTTRAPADPAKTSSTGVKILSAVVNPEGVDENRELFTLINTSSKAVSLEGYRLIGPNKSFMILGEEVLEPGYTQTFNVAPRYNLQLSNKGGTMELVDADGNSLHKVSYSKEDAKIQGGVLGWDMGDKLVIM